MPVSPFSADLKLHASAQASLRAEAAAATRAAKKAAAAAAAAEAAAAAAANAEPTQDAQHTGPLPELGPSIAAQPNLEQLQVPEAPTEGA